jgi:hypothetical protein
MDYSCERRSDARQGQMNDGRIAQLAVEALRSPPPERVHGDPHAATSVAPPGCERG